ncbi:hypothetical protein LptCag_1943 [Leptospirillum ferriphilum]|uniref:Uncharacterized protein n=1 Tax=Leptospirillum ferriphilum TaxID=178606 RepID=A0A094WAG5_9BACT|nr:hypothetical protein LptCag_1943 [Leptospirillum ferriphilum]
MTRARTTKNRIPVRTNPEITVPHRESSGFFITFLLSDLEQFLPVRAFQRLSGPVRDPHIIFC